MVEPDQGAFVTFSTRQRPRHGKRGYQQVGLRHGASTITTDSRTALGIIFHDSR